MSFTGPTKMAHNLGNDGGIDTNPICDLSATGSPPSLPFGRIGGAGTTGFGHRPWRPTRNHTDRPWPPPPR
jgi:hypothetical protein